MKRKKAMSRKARDELVSGIAFRAQPPVHSRRSSFEGSPHSQMSTILFTVSEDALHYERMRSHAGHFSSVRFSGAINP